MMQVQLDVSPLRAEHLYFTVYQCGQKTVLVHGSVSRAEFGTWSL